MQIVSNEDSLNEMSEPGFLEICHQFRRVVKGNHIDFNDTRLGHIH